MDRRPVSNRGRTSRYAGSPYDARRSRRPDGARAARYGDGRYDSGCDRPRSVRGDRVPPRIGGERPRAAYSANARRVGAPNRRPQAARRPRRNASGLAQAIRRLKTNELSTILVNSALAALALVAVLAVLALFRPQINLARVRRLANAHNFKQAEALLERLEGEGLSAAAVEKARYDLGERMLSAGEYDQAEALAETLPADERARELQRRARYGEADALYAAGDYEAAAQGFYQLGDYSDSASRYDDARAAVAVKTLLAGDSDGAYQLLMGIQDVYAHVSAAALAVGGSEAEAQRILASDILSRDRLTEMERNVAALSSAHSSVDVNRVAAGDRHTLGLRSDGTVLACGDNAQGQCDVSGWTDVRQVAAGALHSLGLRSDGTVLACGDNAYGQCDVSDWSGITAIAANAYGSFGLRADGTVVATQQYADLVSGWHDVTRLSGGSYSAGCLYGQGSMLCTHKAAQLGMSSALTDLSVCGAVSASILADGTLVSSYENAPKWSGLRQAHVMQTGIVAVTLDGRASLYSFRGAAEIPLQVNGAAMEAAGTGTHVVVRTEDGAVFAFGDNRYGQCDVSAWRLN